MAQIPFGNDPAKIEKYRSFWNRDDVARPLVGFSMVGWFPMEEFAVCQNWESSDFLTLDMFRPQNFMDDHVRLAREGEVIDDDMIRGACPTQVAVPFLPAMLGNPLRILPQNILGDERKLSWDEAFEVGLDAFLEIEELSCFQINNDAVGLPVADMVPYFQKVQASGRSQLVRGAFTSDEMRLLMDSLDSRGLFLNIMVKNMAEIETLRPIVGM